MNFKRRFQRIEDLETMDDKTTPQNHGDLKFIIARKLGRTRVSKSRRTVCSRPSFGTSLALRRSSTRTRLTETHRVRNSARAQPPPICSVRAGGLCVCRATIVARSVAMRLFVVLRLCWSRDDARKDIARHSWPKKRINTFFASVN